MFDLLVIAYLFLGGAASGGYFVMSVWSLLFHHNDEHHSQRFRNAFKAMLSRAYVILTLALFGSILCLIWDLGIPNRAMLVFTRPRFTVITFGAFALSAQVVIGLILAAANVFNLQIIGGRIRKTLEIITVPLSLSIMIYTGVLLAVNESVAFWNTPWLVALFLFSSLSSGVSAVLLVDYFAQGQTLILRATKPLQKAHLACLALEGAALAAFFHAGINNPFARPSIELAMQPEMQTTVILGVGVLGIVLPFLLETFALTRKECRTIPFSDVVCLIGSFCLRFFIIMCGAH